MVEGLMGEMKTEQKIQQIAEEVHELKEEKGQNLEENIDIVTKIDNEDLKKEPLSGAVVGHENDPLVVVEMTET